MYNKKIFESNIKAAAKREKCDLVIEGVTVVDVFQGETFSANIAIKNGYIIGFGDYEAERKISGNGKYICPTLIDAHAHIESSFLTPREYSKSVLKHGVGAAVVDPHEISNVLGKKGIDFMINESRGLPFDFHFMLPSCVPATEWEISGAVLNSEDLKAYYNNKKVTGLAEVMDYPAVLEGKQYILDKIYDSLKNNRVVDGHCAGFSNDLLDVYGTARITTDHESHQCEEVIEKIRRGIYVFLREGTAAKNLEDLIPTITNYNSRRICLCTDDRHIDDIVNYGSIDNAVRLCINHGINPTIAIQMGTINIAECYKLNNVGAIAPGYKADFIILDDLNEFKINSVYKDGKIVVENNKFLFDLPERSWEIISNNTVNIGTIEKEDVKINLRGKSILNVLEIIPNKLETNHIKMKISELNLNDEFEFLPNEDIIKAVVVERHRDEKKISLGAIKGLKIKSGAVATTIAHDSHNIISCGTNDIDIIKAIERLKEIKGGIVVVNNGKILAEIQLEIAGLITARTTEEVLVDLSKLHLAIDEIAPNVEFNICLTLSFLALPVIPELKITANGLFDVLKFKFISVVE